MNMIAALDKLVEVKISVDSDVKEQAQRIYDALGLDLSIAFNVFLRQTIRKNGLPCDLTLETPKIPVFGCMKDKMWEADDHDWFKPLEDFKEYM
jgi:DNA-damage-inducible protein J